VPVANVRTTPLRGPPTARAFAASNSTLVNSEPLTSASASDASRACPDVPVRSVTTASRPDGAASVTSAASTDPTATPVGSVEKVNSNSHGGRPVRSARHVAALVVRHCVSADASAAVSTRVAGSRVGSISG